MSIMSSVGKLLSPNDPELVEKTLARITEQDTWNDVFSTKLIELLDNIDQINGEIRQRMRQADERIQKAESVTQAEVLLLDGAAKAEAIGYMLAAKGDTLEAVRLEYLAAKNLYEGADTVRAESKVLLADVERRFKSTHALWEEAIAQHKSATKLNGTATAAYQTSCEKLEESSGSYVVATKIVYSAKSGFQDARDHLKEAVLAQQQASTNAADARNQLEKATGLLDDARTMAVETRGLAEDAKKQFQSAQDAQVDAARFSHLTVRYATSAVALSWIAMSWAGWFIVRTRPLFWTALVLSILLIAVVITIMRGTEIEA
jgi:hypothetical protein